MYNVQQKKIGCQSVDKVILCLRIIPKYIYITVDPLNI